MQTKEKKQASAWDRLYHQLARYEAGEYDPSSKDIRIGVSLEMKIIRCRKEIEILEHHFGISRKAVK